MKQPIVIPMQITNYRFWGKVDRVDVSFTLTDTRLVIHGDEKIIDAPINEVQLIEWANAGNMYSGNKYTVEVAHNDKTVELELRASNKLSLGEYNKQNLANATYLTEIPKLMSSYGADVPNTLLSRRTYRSLDQRIVFIGIAGALLLAAVAVYAILQYT